ncbi:unnamed protein product [Arabidopsis thaliana]|uniref:(thale cress) hypothetical protein n=1 Tax=Arabidopsis thaliana TaxID=3702 RepID=A0A7G2ELR3_ARATH|nr:unnamed protein product [Arabidopsis thaliana]
MGFSHKLWDETLAGPTPENGLGKLRNHISGESANRKLMVDLKRVPNSPDRSSNPVSPLTRMLPFLKILSDPLFFLSSMLVL